MDSFIPSINEAGFAEAVAAGITLVDVWAPWCGPCRALGATLEQMAPALAPRVKVIKVNMESCEETMAHLQVMALPTLLLFKNGELMARRVGAIGRLAIEEFLSNH